MEPSARRSTPPWSSTTSLPKRAGQRRQPAKKVRGHRAQGGPHRSSARRAWPVSGARGFCHWRCRRSMRHADHGSRCSAAVTVFRSSNAIVSGPTPPGTGVSAPATSATSGCTSPTTTAPRLLEVAHAVASAQGRARRLRSGSVTRLIPTSMTVAPGLTYSGRTKAVRPTAATRMSACRVIAGRSAVLE